MDFALYIAISVAFISVAVGGSLLAGLSFLKWLNLTIFTALIYGYWLADNHANRSWSFWVLTGGIFLTHIVGLSWILIRVEWFKPVWLALIAFGELVALIWIRTWLPLRTGLKGSCSTRDDTLHRHECSFLEIETS
jgi:hypothetical protein